MASSILASLLSSPQAKFTNELTGTACWTGIKIAKIDILSDSANSDQPLSTEQVTESTVSNGLISTDVATAKILRPSRLRIDAICPDISTVDSVTALFADVTATISVTTKSIIASLLSVVNVTVVHDPEMLSASRLLIDLEQILLPKSGLFSPEQQGDASNYGLSVQTPVSVGGALRQIGSQVGTTINNAGDAVSGLFNRIKNNIGVAGG